MSSSGSTSTASSNGSSAGSSSKSLKTHDDLFFKGDKHVRFNLHNYLDLDKPHKLKFNSNMESDWVNKDWETVFFIHGFLGGHYLADIMQNGKYSFSYYFNYYLLINNFKTIYRHLLIIIAAYLSEQNHSVNLIEVNWLRGAYSPTYINSAKRVSSVGKTVSKFIALNKDKINLEKLVIVGHSLGAQAAGFGIEF